MGIKVESNSYLSIGHSNITFLHIAEIATLARFYKYHYNENYTKKTKIKTSLIYLIVIGRCKPSRLIK